MNPFNAGMPKTTYAEVAEEVGLRIPALIEDHIARAGGWMQAI